VAIPNGEASAIERAFREFDEHLRDSPDWVRWANRAQLFAIERNGRRYPPKKIISLATLVPVAEFSGGRESNQYLRARGFDVVPLEHDDGADADQPVRASSEVKSMIGGRISMGRLAEANKAGFHLPQSGACTGALGRIRYGACIRWGTRGVARPRLRCPGRAHRSVLGQV
jgi:5-methylcytosine-specific restriction enzyme A